MNKKTITQIILVVAFITGSIGIFFIWQSNSVDNQIQVFSTQEECEQTTGKKCDFVMCDHISKGSSCGEDFKGKGWYSIDSQQQNEIDDGCELEPETGFCKARFIRYYFDQEEGLCKEFIWGGCEGLVPFETLEECQQACEDNNQTCIQTEDSCCFENVCNSVKIDCIDGAKPKFNGCNADCTSSWSCETEEDEK